MSSTYNPAPEHDAAQPELAASDAQATAVENPVWSITDVAVIALFTFCALLLFSIIALPIASMIPALKGMEEGRLATMPLVLLPPQVLAYLLMLRFSAKLIRRKGGGNFLAAIKWRLPGQLLQYAGLGVLLAVFMQAASHFLPIPKSLPMDQYFRDRLSAFLMLGFGVTLAPFFEEVFFRGLLYPALLRMRSSTWMRLSMFLLLWPAWRLLFFSAGKLGLIHRQVKAADLYASMWITVFIIAIIWLLALRTSLLERHAMVISLIGTAGLFALIHGEQLGHSWAPLLVIFIVGLALTLVRIRTQSVGASFIVHAFYNGTLFLAVYIASNGFRNFDRLG